MAKIFKYTILSLISLQTLSCYQAASFRLYNLDKAEVLEINLSKGIKTHGIIDSVHFNGEIFCGEYLFHLHKSNTFYSNNYYAKADTQKTFSIPEQKNFADSLLKAYGFSKKSTVSPAGFLTISGNKGTVIDVIFYMFYYERGIATGIGKDNKGNVFRAFLAEKE